MGGCRTRGCPPQHALPNPPFSPLQIGASSAWFVRALMFVCSPLAWPIGKLLDILLGGEHTVGEGG